MQVESSFPAEELTALILIDLSFTRFVFIFISFLEADGLSPLSVECVFIGPTALGTLARKAKTTPVDKRGSENAPGRFGGMSSTVTK